MGRPSARRPTATAAQASPDRVSPSSVCAGARPDSVPQLARRPNFSPSLR
jgi:hypothetical protein